MSNESKTVKLTAVHMINYLLNGKQQTALSGAMFEIDGDRAQQLIKVGAAREPSEQELAVEKYRQDLEAGKGSKKAAPADTNDDDASDKKQRGKNAKKDEPEAEAVEGDSEKKGIQV